MASGNQFEVAACYEIRNSEPEMEAGRTDDWLFRMCSCPHSVTAFLLSASAVTLTAGFRQHLFHWWRENAVKKISCLAEDDDQTVGKINASTRL
jgi:hypothetical protein